MVICFIWRRLDKETKAVVIDDQRETVSQTEAQVTHAQSSPASHVRDLCSPPLHVLPVFTTFYVKDRERETNGDFLTHLREDARAILELKQDRDLDRGFQPLAYDQRRLIDSPAGRHKCKLTETIIRP